MSDLTIGAADSAAIVHPVTPVSPLFGNLLQLQLNLDVKIANAFEAAIDAIVEEKKAAAKIDLAENERRPDAEEDEQILETSNQEMSESAGAPEEAETAPDLGAAEREAGATNQHNGDQLAVEASDKHTAIVAVEVKVDQDRSVENTAENIQAEEVVQSRALAIIDQFRDELVRRMVDIDLLSDNELFGFAKILLKDASLEAIWQVQQESLEQEAAKTRDALARLAGRLEGSWPRDTADALAEHIATRISGTIDATEVDRMATDILACAGADNIASLVARSMDPELDSAAKRTAAFDALLAMTYAERLLNEQASAAWNAVEQDLQQLPEVSQGRKYVEAMLEITKQIPEAETRKAVEAYYDSLTYQESHIAAREVLDRLLVSQDALLFEYLVRLAQESSFDSRVALALSSDPEVSTRARRQIEQAAAEDQRARPQRLSPFAGELEPDGTDFHLAKTEVLEAVRVELLKMDNPVEAAELHVEGRLRNALAVFEIVAHLMDKRVIEPETPVAIGGALFQLGKGSQVEDSQAAHKLAGQVYIGIDPDTLVQLDAEQRQPYRLDTLLQSDAELAMLARVLAASTTVLPSYINKVDSLWESKGLRDAFEQGISRLVDQEAVDAAAVAQAFEAFRASAAEALALVRDHNEAKLRGLEAERIEADTAQQSLQEAHLVRMQVVIDLYKAVLAETDANQARMRLQDWLATAGDRKDEK